MNKRKIFIVLISVFSLFFCSALILCYRKNEKDFPVCINEICTNNFSGLLDNASGTYADWVEIYNKSDEEQDLTGYILSQGKKNEKSYIFDELKLGPHSYILIYCNGIEHELVCAPFKLSSEGETLCLSTPDGQMIDSVEIPALKYDECYARKKDGGSDWTIMTPTPYQTNADALTITHATLDKPVLSLQNGFYDEKIPLTMSGPETAVLFYTTDGSEPTIYSQQYTEPIILENASSHENVYTAYTNINQDYSYTPPDEPVTKANIIRVRAITADGQYSDIVTGVYFVGMDKEFMDDNSCILSLVTDPANLFDDDKGIYVTGSEYDAWYQNGQQGDAPKRNYERTGTPSERRAVLDFFSEDKELIASQDVGIRIQGNSTRNQRKKRFSIVARKGYSGSNYFTSDLIDSEIPVHSFTLFNDVNNLFISELMKEREVGTQRGKKCKVFIDGEYWEDYYLIEKISGDFLAEHYQVNKDNTVLIKNETVANGSEADKTLYEELNEYLLNTDFTEEDTYQQLCNVIDIQSFLDHFCACLYCANMNWHIINNHILWRSRDKTDSPYEDGKWRWIVNDFDMYYDLGADLDSFQMEMHFGGTYMNSGYLPNLLKNETFKKQFVLTYLDLANEYFTPEKAAEVVEKYENNPSLEQFFTERFDYAIEDMYQALELKGKKSKVELSENIDNAGKEQLNSLTLDISNGWKGVYYTDYPVRLRAIPEKGFVFKGWSINGNQNLLKESEIELDLTNQEEIIEAVYQKE